MRFSVEEAIQRGWLNDQEARALRRQGKAQRQQYSEELPQERLYRALSERFGDRAMSEYAGAVPGRRYRIDIAFPDQKLGIECDGFSFHRSLKAFKSDRRRRNDLVIHGWRILNYFPEQIFKELDAVVAQVAQALGEHRTHGFPTDEQELLSCRR